MQDVFLPPLVLADRSTRPAFAVNPLNRMSERRDDASFLAGLREAAETRSLVISGEIPVLKTLSQGHDALFTLTEAAELGALRETAFLGLQGETGLFAALIETEAPESAQARSDIAMIDLRTIAAQDLVPAEILGALAQAKSLMHWHARHRFCSNCGAPSRPTAAGWRRSCDACGAQHFPRTDPVVIMLVVSDGDCLLGHHTHTVRAGYGERMYSCLAGFMETGETIEDAVRREVCEETGVKVGRVGYLASQPWPFPASLMIGCIAQAESRDVTIDGKELDDARWFSRGEAAMMLNGGHPDGLICPPKLAIANLLIASWIAGEAN